MPVTHRFDGVIVVVRAEGAHTPDDLKDAMLRMGSVFAELGGVAPAVFNSYDAARTWLVGAPRPDD